MIARRTSGLIMVLLWWCVSMFVGSNASAAASGTSPTSVKVFVFAGQSNMAGRALAAKLPSQFRTPPPRVQIDYVCSFGASDALQARAKVNDASASEPHRSNGWVALRPAPKHSSTPGEHFGPEIGFGHTLANHWPEQRIAIVKHG